MSASGQPVAHVRGVVPCTPPKETRMSRSTRSRWRSTALLALTATTAVTMVGASTASAAWSEHDPDTGNNTPAGYGSAPDPGGNSSSSSSGGGNVIATEVDSTVPVSGSSCRWTVKGHVLVRNPTLPGLSDGEAVAGIEVKVSGADW